MDLFIQLFFLCFKRSHLLFRKEGKGDDACFAAKLHTFSLWTRKLHPAFNRHDDK